MSQRLAGKKALITAAGQGIGRACALAFAAEGASVIATDINLQTLATLDAEAHITTRQLDVTDPEAINACAAELGALDILANIAGYVHHGSILACSEDDWDFSFTLNVRSMFRTIQAFLPAMMEAGGGSIINMSSVSSSLSGLPDRFIYGTTKAAIIGLTKSVARDFIAQSIRCNAICPGTVQTPSLDDRINAFDDPVEARTQFIARQPMGRLGTTAEIAAAAVYLASDEAAYTTGTAMILDGGITL
ncbi:SDR family oxidoreductase [Candidatus Entotheonella palauensis]|uniref:SDR family oxidoreductase n=1 Tax=Candidatus Entotheonella palauensis TaxID=93172 RepID=UPI000B7DA5B2|nr:SDR family oxidoreductase [Candidatus Entotheonella palauensis]